ncbi:MAG: DUF2505 domain-containing protein [Actinobacteria bacterium]|nr:DUF2505 domain-containing protein [Actinomycetota bacterium]
MRFQIVQSFDGPLDQVEDALVDPAFLERLGELPKLGRPELMSRVVEGPLVHQEVRYRFTGELSAAVRKVVDPQRLTWVEKSSLDRRAHRSTWHIVSDHYKHLLRCSGTFELHEAGGATRRTTQGEIKVSVPFVGGKVEAAIVSGLREHAQMEERVMAGWLEQR